MALPLPKVVADVGPGGGLVTAMGGINSLANENVLRQINQIKKQYLPMTLNADASSKLAYARLMYPQFMAKLMANEGFLGNTTEDQKKNNLRMLEAAGSGQGTGNSLNQMQMPNGIGQPSTNSFSGYIANALKGMYGQNKQQEQQPQNSFAQMGGQQAMPQQEAPQQVAQQSSPQDMPGMGGDGVNNEAMSAYDEWLRSEEGQAELTKGESANIPDEKEIIQWKRNKDASNDQMQLSLTGGQRQPTYAENTGGYKGTVKEGEELGKHRANVINDIGEQQMALSTSGANLDKLIGDLNDPKFMSLRNEIPFFQDTQLKALTKVGTPEQQEMIGNFIADAKSFAGSTVNSFKGATMKREFDYADQLKPTENDTVNTARGKVTALKTLKEIAERKNDIILDLMQSKHMNLGDAVKRANKMVDTKAVDKEVRQLTQPSVTIVNKKTGQRRTISAEEARKLGVPNV